LGIPEATDDGEFNPQLLLYPALAKQFTHVEARLARTLPRKQYPRLISFFGDTGMGKSTIIKNLIRHLTSSELFETPVSGTVAESQNSISGGVHVYADPGTFSTSRPLIYTGWLALVHYFFDLADTGTADSEGLRGDSIPIANQVELQTGQGVTNMRSRPALRNRVGRLAHSVTSNSSPHSSRTVEKTRRSEAVAAFSMPWSSDPDLPEPWPSMVVRKIYPRFLYIFSDVVCYVTGNSRYGS
jgi:hypothetical protein